MFPDGRLTIFHKHNNWPQASSPRCARLRGLGAHPFQQRGTPSALDLRSRGVARSCFAPFGRASRVVSAPLALRLATQPHRYIPLRLRHLPLVKGEEKNRRNLSYQLWKHLKRLYPKPSNHCPFAVKKCIFFRVCLRTISSAGRATDS